MKKLISLILIACVLVSVGVFGTSAASENGLVISNNGSGMSGNTYYGLLGDANEDGAISIKDATAIQKYIAVLTLLGDVGTVLADVDMNSEVNIKDTTNIQKYIAEISVVVQVGKQIYATPSYELHHHALDDIVVYDGGCTETSYIIERCVCGAGVTNVIEADGHDFEGYYCTDCYEFDTTQTYDYLVDYILYNYDYYYDGGIYSVFVEFYDYDDGSYDNYELMYYSDRDSLVFYYDAENYTDYTYDRIMLIVPRDEDYSAVGISGCDVYFNSSYLDYDYTGAINNATFDGDVDDIVFFDGGYSNYFTEESIKEYGANMLDSLLYEMSYFIYNYTSADIRDLGFLNY